MWRGDRFVDRARRAALVGAAGGLVTYLGVLRAPIMELARAAGRPPTVAKGAVVVAVSALLAIVVGELMRRVFDRAAEAEDRDHDRAV